jgi:beta-mannosidase
MKRIYDLSALTWTVEGYTPNVWLFERMHGVGFGSPVKCIDVPSIPARVPGSVQGALREAGILPDWNIGFNARNCEWVENRHWMYRTYLPAEWYAGLPNEHAQVRLECMGLDYSGWVLIDGKEVGTFKGTHTPHIFNLTPFLNNASPPGVATRAVLEIAFDLPPRWLGQFGYSSRMTEWKTRFNYTWDWTPRLVQIGIWDRISLAVVEGGEIQSLDVTADADPQTGTGRLELSGRVVGLAGSRVELHLEKDPVRVTPNVEHREVQEHDRSQASIWSASLSLDEFARGAAWSNLSVELWWPNLTGDGSNNSQPLYTLTCCLIDSQGNEHDRLTRLLGFRNVAWLPCEGAPPEADPWVCAVNGQPVFMQGVNFAPLKSNFADLRREDYEKRLRQYQDLGVNTFRINACQFLEREWFYDLCDELGLMVWQEFPITSSGVENWPPEDETAIAEMADIARSYITRRRHHASLVLWSGSNEQQGSLDGSKVGIGKPCDLSHPMLRRLGEVVQELDPGRRYIPTSPLGPRAGANPDDFGKGLHWAVHGPNAGFKTVEEAEAYWASDDALFRPEVYCPGASTVELIHKYAGDLPVFPADYNNLYFTHPTPWWVDWPRVVAAYGRQPADLQEYVDWSRALHARFISIGARACKERFPRCGGFLLWSGHDTFPMPANTSLIDYDGNLKPAALALREIWRGKH